MESLPAQGFENQHGVEPLRGVPRAAAGRGVQGLRHLLLLMPGAGRDYAVQLSGTQLGGIAINEIRDGYRVTREPERVPAQKGTGCKVFAVSMG